MHSSKRREKQCLQLCGLDNNCSPNYGPRYSAHALTLTYKNFISYKDSKHQLLSILSGYPRFRYAFYGEFTKEGNVHWHGTLYESNKLKYNKFIVTWNKLYGYTKESKIGNLIGWHIYCLKQQSLFKQPYNARVTDLLNKEKQRKTEIRYINIENYYKDDKPMTKKQLHKNTIVNIYPKRSG